MERIVKKGPVVRGMVCGSVNSAPGWNTKIISEELLLRIFTVLLTVNRSVERGESA